MSKVKSNTNSKHRPAASRPGSERLRTHGVRADLANVVPIYYPIVEQARFGSLAAVAEHVGLPLEFLEQYRQRSIIERSDYVVCDRLILGDADLKVCAVLVFPEGDQSVVLCAAFFREARDDRAVVEAFINEMLSMLGPVGQDCPRLGFIGEFRLNPKRVQQ